MHSATANEEDDTIKPKLIYIKNIKQYRSGCCV